ncbi:hypothetical protein F2P81_013268 [Scophthalmus maximus]|uniref:Uncharacterized protein n=1 Tax=Scophthalmus maximus TaxID=52904 RepID=A0A6A4SUE8_SCOMX|nr:hypothetical protein F2P81_013268 [Scophthalmus maximus]
MGGVEASESEGEPALAAAKPSRVQRFVQVCSIDGVGSNHTQLQEQEKGVEENGGSPLPIESRPRASYHKLLKGVMVRAALWHSCLADVPVPVPVPGKRVNPNGTNIPGQ